MRAVLGFDGLHGRMAALGLPVSLVSVVLVAVARRAGRTRLAE